MSWTTDGKTLLACSMDGSVAAVILSSKEMGTPIPDSKQYELMRDRYGKNFGTIANIKTSATMTNGAGPVVIENPEMLKNDANIKTTNGHDFSRSNSATSKNRLYPQGPTDKQIEARTSDGKRRITPIYIPMSTAENGTQISGTASRFGITEFGSSSTQERSKIAIEKRNDVVKPNVSPNKVICNNESSAEPLDKTEDQNKEPGKDVKAKKPETTEPKANIIQVHKFSALFRTISTKCFEFR